MTGEVGLLGGTFDPPHLGHLVVAEHARVLLGLDEVRLLVAGQPWMKDMITPADHRTAMVRLATADHDQVTVDDRETRRDGPTYTADTLEQLAGEQPDTRWTFLLGADAAARLDRWKRIDAARALARFVAVARPGHRLDAVQGLSTLRVPLIGISSTELRRRFGDGGPTRYLLPTAVDDYVREHGLYGAGP